MEEKVVAIVFDAVTLGGDSAISDEYVAKSALEVATSPLAWKRAVALFTYTQQIDNNRSRVIGSRLGSAKYQLDAARYTSSQPSNHRIPAVKYPLPTRTGRTCTVAGI